MLNPWTLCLLSLLLTVQICNGIKWLSLFRYPRDKSIEREPFSREECTFVHYNYGLKRKQMKFCQHPQMSNAMHAVVKSAQAVAYYCPHIFKDRRWNCSSIENLPHPTADLTRGTREQAAVYALSSATMMFEVARRCAMGKIGGCECGMEDWDVPPQPHLIDMIDGESRIGGSKFERLQGLHPSGGFVGYHWGGCADNIASGREYASSFLGFQRNTKRENKVPDKIPAEYQHKTVMFTGMGGHKVASLYRMKRTKPAQSFKKMLKTVNFHNYKVGMKILEDSQKIRCKCQGVSGSCAHKICFRELLRIDSAQLQSIIMQRYMMAKHVSVEYENLLIAKEFNYGAYAPHVIHPGDLAFINHSPDYCERDVQFGSVGTYGRACLADPARSKQSDSCDNMCCSRGYQDYNETIFENCNCKISKEFKIHCNRCSNVKRHYACN